MKDAVAILVATCALWVWAGIAGRRAREEKTRRAFTGNLRP